MQVFRTIVLGLAIVGVTADLASAMTPAALQTPPPATPGQQPPPKPTPTPTPTPTALPGAEPCWLMLTKRLDPVVRSRTNRSGAPLVSFGANMGTLLL